MYPQMETPGGTCTPKQKYEWACWREVETEYEEECEKAKENWINDTCSRMEVITDPKEKWRQFKSLTSYRDEDVGGVLPLLNENRPVFDANEKGQLLQDVFFGGNHMEGETFDEDFRKEVDRPPSRLS